MRTAGPLSPSDGADLFRAGLKNLDIEVARDTSSVAEPHPSFHLHTLTLRGFGTPAALTNALLTSSFSSLRSLTTVCTQSKLEPALLSALPLVANSLVSLTLFNPIRNIGPVLSSFTALTSLKLELYDLDDLDDLDEYDRLLASLAPPIECLKLEINTPQPDPRIMPALVERLASRKAWQGLKNVRINHFKVNVAGTEAGAAFWALCKEKGVNLRPWRGNGVTY